MQLGALGHLDLTDSEKRVWDAFPRGEKVDLGGPDPRDAAAVWPPATEVRAEVIQSLLLSGIGHNAPGWTIRLFLVRARIRGELDLDDAVVDVSMAFERCRFDDDGIIDLGDGNTRGIWINGCRMAAITARGLLVSGPFEIIDCRMEFVDLRNANITGRLDLSRTVLTRGKDGMAVNAAGLSVGHALSLPPAPTDGSGFDLSHARVRQALQLSAPPPAAICLDGTECRSLEPSLSVRDCLELLKCGRDGYHPQPYEQLAKHYTSHGHDDHERKLLLAKHRRRRASVALWKRPGSWFFDLVAGYGFVPERTLLIGVAAVVAGIAFYAVRPPSAMDGQVEFTLHDNILFVFDAILPTSPFGAEARWSTIGGGKAVLLTLQAIGWVLFIAVVPAVARKLVRDSRRV